MKRYYDDKGNTTIWLSDKPKREELQKLTISQLILIAKNKRGIKKFLIDFLSTY